MNCKKMRNSKLLCLWSFSLWLMAAPLQAQFLVSTETAPHWFCLQVLGTSEESTTDLVLTAENDRVFGRTMTTSTELSELTKQLWRIELNSATGNYAVVNRASGKKLSIIYDAELATRVAVLSATPSTEWAIHTVTSGRRYFQAVTQPSGGIKDAVVLTLGSANNFAVTFAKIRTNSCLFDAANFQPIISDEHATVWYNFGSVANGKALTSAGELPGTPNIKFLLADRPEQSATTQQWKLVAIPDKTGYVDIVNRADGKKVGTTPKFAHFYYAQYAEPGSATDGWKLNALGGGQYELQTTDQNEVHRYWHANDEGSPTGEYIPGAPASSWLLQWVSDTFEPGTGSKTVLPSNVKVYVQNRRIVVEGADDYAVHTLVGVRAAKNTELPQGVYLVTVKGQTVKRVIK
jgi:hypothetical protein